MSTASLTQRLRQIVAAEDDDFFKAETLVFYINKSARKTISALVQIEQESKKSLRALDKLRQYKDIAVNGLTFIDRGLSNNTYILRVPFPTTAGEEINQYSYLRYGNKTPLRELTHPNLIKLEWGNLHPTVYEGYYQVTRDSGNTVFELYVYQTGVTTGSIPVSPIVNTRIYYVKQPTAIELEDITFTDIPDQLENAILYGAATMMLMQEGVRSQENAAALFEQMFEKELRLGAY